MLFDILFNQLTFAIVIPVLIIAGIVFALRPGQDEVTYNFDDYKPAPVDTADITQVIPRVPNPTYGHYDTYDTKPVRAIFGEEMERQMMARVIAFSWLYEEGQKQKAIFKQLQNDLALCA